MTAEWTHFEEHVQQVIDQDPYAAVQPVPCQQ